jgi:hypothetical protein
MFSGSVVYGQSVTIPILVKIPEVLPGNQPSSNNQPSSANTLTVILNLEESGRVDFALGGTAPLSIVLNTENSASGNLFSRP